MAGVPSRSRKGLFAALALLVLMPVPAACAADRYMGISLEPGGNPEVQALARRARSGDQQAQFELARLFEEGRGFPHDLRRAERLYLLASLDRGGTRYAYSPPQQGDRRGGTVPVSQGPRVRGIPEARVGWVRVRSERLARDAAQAAPIGLRNEAYLARKLAVDRQLGVPGAVALPVLSIRGPVRLSGRIAPVNASRGRELCAALHRLIAHYRDYGFEDCEAFDYSTSNRRNAGGAPPILLRYRDRYRPDQDGGGGDPEHFYRPPFSSALQLNPGQALCGSFQAFDVRLTSGETYRLVITDEPNRGGAAAAQCPAQ
jgi:hypothetical protein